MEHIGDFEIHCTFQVLKCELLAFVVGFCLNTIKFIVMHQILESLHLYIQKECGLLPSQLILVGVSGGPDSVFLLDALHRIGYSVIAAHYNHHLRADSDKDVAFVKILTDSIGVPFVVGEGKVSEFSRKERLSIEESARILRYRFLFECAQQMGAQAVAVGHTADDQVETVLMHFLRGAGLDGLKGMLPRAILPVWHNHIPLVRPLLEIHRESVLSYCQEQGWQPRLDLTNLDTTLFRNRLRHELIPELETYNPRFREVITRTAKTLAADQVALQGITDLAWQECMLRLGQTYLALSTSAFVRHPLGIQRRLLRKGIASLRPGLRDVDFAAVERAIQFLTEKQDGVCELTGNLRVFAEGKRFWLAENESDLPTDEWPQVSKATMDGAPILLGVSDKVSLREGWVIRAEQFAPSGLVTDQPDRAWLDVGDLPLPLTIRTRRPGDVFQPLGMAGKVVKLSEFMINVKIPRRTRDAWPLICVGKQIAWIPGVRLAEPFRVTETTRKVIQLRLERN